MWCRKPLFPWPNTCRASVTIPPSVLSRRGWRPAGASRPASPPRPHAEVSERDDENGPMREEPDQAPSELEKIWDAEWEKHLLRVAMSRVKRRLIHSIRSSIVSEQEHDAGKSGEGFDIPVGQVYLAKHRVTSGEEINIAKRDDLKGRTGTLTAALRHRSP